MALDDELASAQAARIRELLDALGGVLFGQERLLRLVVTGLLSRGHLLLEGLPGLGKTELVKALSQCLGLSAGRIQFTPDLLPGDITGNPVLEDAPEGRRFVFREGPLFANLVLADEINRASPKTQSALLEAMQEGRVTVLGETHPLPAPFFVVATQNPIELEGTYPLPEAQLDRFLFKLEVPPASAATLERIVQDREMGVEPEIPRILAKEEFCSLLASVREIHLPAVVSNYIARLVDATRRGGSTAAARVKYGASPRAALALAAAAKAAALMDGRIHAGFEDVVEVAVPVLQHRIVLDYEARIEGLAARDVAAALVEEIPRQNLDLPATLAAD